MSMTADDVKAISQTAAREAVREMLLAMGVDASDPAAMIEMQKDFQSLRQWRKSVQDVQRYSIITAVGILISGVAGMIYMHFRH